MEAVLDRPDTAFATRLRRHRLFAELPAAMFERAARNWRKKEVATGAHVIEEGGDGRELYVLLAGVARIVRGGLDVGRVTEGEIFGELALVANKPRAASIVAATPLELACLDRQGYDALCAELPELSRALLEALVATLGDRLTHVTDAAVQLFRERSLPRRTEIEIDLGGAPRKVRTGTTPRELLPEQVNGAPVVGALIDARPTSLSTPLSGSCRLEPLTTEHWEGRRIYEESLEHFLLDVASVSPGMPKLSLGRSVGLGRRVIVDGATAPLALLATELQGAMRAAAVADRPLLSELWTVEEAQDYFSGIAALDAVALLDTWRAEAVPLASYGGDYALRFGPMVVRTGVFRDFAIVADDAGLLLVYRTEHTAAAREVMRWRDGVGGDEERWLQTLSVRHVGDFNRACINGGVSQLIRVAEGFQEKRLSQIADRIAGDKARVRVVVIAGPSSSGKTTFIKRLKVQLEVNGISPLHLSLDDYYLDREKTPKEANGEYDFEALEALDLPLLGRHFARLLAGETVRTARFDFPRGKSNPEGGEEIALSAGRMLMLEGIHGLNPAIVRGLPPEAIFRIFVCPLAQLRLDRASVVAPTDVRLLRRIIRDRLGRNTTAADNILRWPSVRRGERKHIFPFQHHATVVFDTGLPYELSVLKVFAERYLLEVPQEHAAYPTAYRLLGLLEHFVSIYPDHVPPTSLVREFIGGSSFD
jgi:uridine kinase